MIGFFRVKDENGKVCWIRADEVGTFFESEVYAKRGPGRPSAVPKATTVISLLLRHGNRINAKQETIETILSKMKQALGTQIILIEKAVLGEGTDVSIPPPEPDDEEEEAA